MIAAVKNRPLSGIIHAAPCKSITQRALLLTHIAGGSVDNALDCGDTRAMRRCLAALDSGGVMDAGGSATALRMLIPLAMAKNGGGIFRADETLLRRPLEAFLPIGAQIERRGDTVRVSGALKSGDYAVDGSVSSQFASGMLTALAFLGGGRLTVTGERVSKPYIDMTVELLRRFGMDIALSGDTYTLAGTLKSTDVCVGGDWSYAANFCAANALGGSVEIEGLTEDPVQADSAIVRLLRLERADVSDSPDILPCLMAAACGRQNDTVFTGTKRLKYKESDRPNTMACAINALGGSAEVTGDTVTVHGNGRLTGGRVRVNDHRIAMAVAVLAPICSEAVIIEGAECTDKSAPGFFEDIAILGGTDEQHR